VTAVLLGVSRLDALDLDAETQPPDGKLRKIEEAIGRGERHAIVGADRLWQAALLEQALEGRQGAGGFGGSLAIAEKNETTGLVGDGERVAITAVSEFEFALEIRASGENRDGGPG